MHLFIHLLIRYFIFYTTHIFHVPFLSIELLSYINLYFVLKVLHWTHLQNMVQESLSAFKEEWSKLAVKVKEYWKTSQRKNVGEKPNLANYNADIVLPGSSATLALEKDHGKITVHAIPESRQAELCEILIDVCTSVKFAVNQKLIHEAKNGISYLEFKVKQDAKKILQNKELSFYFKVEMKNGEILKYFSIDLSLIQRRGWSKWQHWSVRHESLFPDYDQHKCCGCVTGCGPVAWAMILGFYDRLAHKVPSSGKRIDRILKLWNSIFLQLYFTRNI